MDFACEYLLTYHKRKVLFIYYNMQLCRSIRPTVWYKIIFRHLNGYNLANITDIDKIPFDNCSDINS